MWLAGSSGCAVFAYVEWIYSVSRTVKSLLHRTACGDYSMFKGYCGQLTCVDSVKSTHGSYCFNTFVKMKWESVETFNLALLILQE